jgi:LSD1 subclass zinc finger protein
VALNVLEDASFLKLRKSGALPLAYMQILSMGQMVAFERLNLVQQQLAPPQESRASLDDIFATLSPAFCGSTESYPRGFSGTRCAVCHVLRPG